MTEAANSSFAPWAQSLPSPILQDTSGLATINEADDAAAESDMPEDCLDKERLSLAMDQLENSDVKSQTQQLLQQQEQLALICSPILLTPWLMCGSLCSSRQHRTLSQTLLQLLNSMPSFLCSSRLMVLRLQCWEPQKAEGSFRGHSDSRQLGRVQADVCQGDCLHDRRSY